MSNTPKPKPLSETHPLDEKGINEAAARLIAVESAQGAASEAVEDVSIESSDASYTITESQCTQINQLTSLGEIVRSTVYTDKSRSEALADLNKAIESADLPEPILDLAKTMRDSAQAAWFLYQSEEDADEG